MYNEVPYVHSQINYLYNVFRGNSWPSLEDISNKKIDPNFKEEINKFELKWVGNDMYDMQIFKNDRAILKMYPEYRDEQKKMSDANKTKYYGDLWTDRNIYKKNT